MNVLNSMVRKLTRVHRDLRACECNYIGIYGPVNALNPVARQVARLLKDLQAHVQLHKDLWAYECVEFNAKEIIGVI
jgi:hypothetical protein